MALFGIYEKYDIYGIYDIFWYSSGIHEYYYVYESNSIKKCY